MYNLKKAQTFSLSNIQPLLFMLHHGNFNYEVQRFRVLSDSANFFIKYLINQIDGNVCSFQTSLLLLEPEGIHVLCHFSGRITP